MKPAHTEGTLNLTIFFEVIFSLHVSQHLVFLFNVSDSVVSLRVDWLSFVAYNCELVTFPLVSWFGCGN